MEESNTLLEQLLEALRTDSPGIPDLKGKASASDSGNFRTPSPLDRRSLSNQGEHYQPQPNIATGSVSPVLEETWLLLWERMDW